MSINIQTIDKSKVNKKSSLVIFLSMENFCNNVNVYRLWIREVLSIQDGISLCLFFFLTSAGILVEKNK